MGYGGESGRSDFVDVLSKDLRTIATSMADQMNVLITRNLPATTRSNGHDRVKVGLMRVETALGWATVGGTWRGWME